MSDLRSQLGKLGVRFDAYSRRERGLIAAAIIGGVIWVGFSVLVDPNLMRSRIAERLAAQQTADAQTLESQLQALTVQLQADPDAGRRAEIARLKDELADVENALRNLERGLVAPDRMNLLLERLLASHAGLHLVSLKSLPPVNLADFGKSAEGEAPALPGKMAIGLYKHGVEVRVEGTYAELHAWLRQLEGIQEQILWGDARLQVVEHPRSVMIVSIYTLSTDKAWLAI